MSKPRTLEEALQMVPEYILLRPGQELREDDEELKQSTLGSRWIEPFTIRDAMLAYLKVEPHQIVRRRIPDNVREQSAVRILYNSMAGVPPRGNGWLRLLYPEVDSSEGGIVVACVKYICTEDNYGLHKFSSKEKAHEFYRGLPEHLDDIALYDNSNPIEDWLAGGHQ